jgi:hypothetical protein
MICPVSGGIQNEGNTTNGIFIDCVIELEEDSEASMCKGGTGRFKEDVIKRKRPFGTTLHWHNMENGEKNKGQRLRKS